MTCIILFYSVTLLTKERIKLNLKMNIHSYCMRNLFRTERMSADVPLTELEMVMQQAADPNQEDAFEFGGKKVFNRCMKFVKVVYS